MGDFCNSQFSRFICTFNFLPLGRQPTSDILKLSLQLIFLIILQREKKKNLLFTRMLCHPSQDLERNFTPYIEAEITENKHGHITDTTVLECFIYVMITY